MEASDPDLKGLLDAAETARNLAEDRVRFLSLATPSANATIASTRVTTLAGCLREALLSEDATFRKAYLRLCVD
jgi:hypothetical protein